MLKVIARTVDVLLRGAAVLTALASLPLALFLGIMANDNGNSKTVAITLVVLAAFLAIVSFVIWIAIAARGKWRRVIAYVVGVTGIFVGADVTYERVHNAMPRLEVSKDDVAYPSELNPTPLWTITISGDIDAGVHFNGFEIHYETVVDRDNPANLDEVCSRHINNPEKKLVYPLQRTERAKPEVIGGRYSLSVIVDKFKAGQCKWMASEISLINPDLPTSSSSSLIHPVIEGFSGYYGDGGAEGTKRLDLWCWTVKGQSFHYICGPFPLDPPPASIKQRIESLVPSEARSRVAKANAHPDSSDFQINFHNYDAFLERAGLRLK